MSVLRSGSFEGDASALPRRYPFRTEVTFGKNQDGRGGETCGSGRSVEES